MPRDHPPPFASGQVKSCPRTASGGARSAVEGQGWQKGVRWMQGAQNGLTGPENRPAGEAGFSTPRADPKTACLGVQNTANDEFSQKMKTLDVSCN